MVEFDYDVRKKELSGKNQIYYKRVKPYELATDVDSIFIRKVLEDFINNYKNVTSIRCYIIRLFLMTFQDSLQGILVDRDNWFTMEIFRHQYEFYDDLNKKVKNKTGSLREDELKYKLIAFYRFITSGMYGEKYKTNLSKEFVDAISGKSFYKYYESGFTFMYHDINSNTPQMDKICILPNISSTFNANRHNNERRGFDFSQCNERYKEDLKNFIWANWKNAGSFSQYQKLIQFLTLSFDKQYKGKLIDITKGNKEFGEEFLWNYRIKIKKQFKNTNNVKSIFKIVRKYLKFYSKKYNVKYSDFDILNLEKLAKSSGGNIITENDRNLIYNKFKEKENINKSFKIYTIVFEFFLTTKFRIGEILNFNRDCLTPINDKMYEISYIGKKTGGCFVPEFISCDSADLLIEARELTKNITEKDDLNSDYIFIEKYITSHTNKCKRIPFDYEFKKITEELADVLEKKNYDSSNIRQTFIDNVYKEGRKNNMTIMQMATIAGNSYKVAKRYYRDNNDILNYLEATNKICIADVDVRGKILKNDDNVIENKVKEGLGKCASHNCVFEIGECLRCNFFITYTNRENNFVHAIDEVDILISKEDDKEQIEELVANKKVLVRYLYEIRNIIANERKRK